MSKVNIGLEFQAESLKLEKLPANVLAEVVDMAYVKIKKESFTKKDSGEVVPESEKTYAVLQCVLPESTEPSKVFTHELSCGEILIPSPDGTYLDDVMATTERNKKLQSSSSWAVFASSLRTAGATNGVYTAKEDAIVTDNCKRLIGTRFQVGYSTRSGGPSIGNYSALIATQVFSFGKVDIAADMEAVVVKVKEVLAKEVSASGLSVAELVGKLSDLTSSQFELAKQSFNDAAWLTQVEGTGQVFKRTATGRFLKV